MDLIPLLSKRSRSGRSRQSGAYDNDGMLASRLAGFTSFISKRHFLPFLFDRTFGNPAIEHLPLLANPARHHGNGRQDEADKYDQRDQPRSETQRFRVFSGAPAERL